MKKYLLATISLMLLLLWPIQAMEIGPVVEERPPSPERFTTISETNFLNELALRGLNLDTQGLRIESLDGNTVFADLNSNAGFNPASVTKVATSFAALYKFGADYHFETAFLADGTVNPKTHTLDGDLVLESAGDPVLTANDVTHLLHLVLNAGITRVTGDLVVTGPFTYNAFLNTDSALKHLEPLARKLGIRFSSVRRAAGRGTRIASHVSSSLSDIIFVQNAHSVNQTAERLGEAVGGPKGVEKFLVQQVGVAPSEVSLSHTSGLEINRITPHAEIALLRHLVVWLNLHSMLPEDVMPVAGIDPGTLHARLTSADTRGAVVAKTGTLPETDGGVSSLAGIVYTHDRGPILFAIFNMKGPVNTYRRMQDNLLKDLLAECGGSEAVSPAARKSGNE